MLKILRVRNEAVAERIVWIMSVFQNSERKKERHLLLSRNALSVHEALALGCK